MKKNQNKNIAIFAFSLMVLIGTYNAVMINSESTLSDATNLQRLDQIYGVKSGRSLAVAMNWRKVSKAELAVAVPEAVKANVASLEASSESIASIQDSLNMKLVEVINAKKWGAGVSKDKFSGAIETNSGVIESLVATLPDNMNIEISFSEMNGNVFEYDLNGEVYSGMMYQVDQSAYMITMTNGPLEGTRLRFAGEVKESDSQNYLAETHNVEVQNFGSDSEAPEVQVSETAAVPAAEVSSFNFNI